MSKPGRIVRPVLWGGAAALLALPLVAMQFSDEVAWTGFDFAIAATLIGVVGLTLEGVMHFSRNPAYRAGAATAILAALLLVFVNGAVGFLGDESNPANLMFAGVLGTAVLGAVFSGFRAAGMAVAMFAAAGVQVAIAIVAVAAGLGSPGEAGLYEAVMGTSVFATLWLISAGLFRLAARRASTPA